jgi:hypothetical protein
MGEPIALEGDVRPGFSASPCRTGSQQVSSCVDERRARVQPCHIPLALMRAIRWGTFFQSFCAERSCGEGGFARTGRKAYLSG